MKPWETELGAVVGRRLPPLAGALGAAVESVVAVPPRLPERLPEAPPERG